MKKLNEAIVLATKYHSWQYRWDWTPYILHPLRVLNKLIEKYWIEDENLLICWVLHDTLEDTSLTLREVKERFWEEVSIPLSFLTKDSDYSSYIKELKLNKIAVKVKLADLEDNSNIKDCIFSWSSDKKLAERHLNYLKAYKELKWQ